MKVSIICQSEVEKHLSLSECISLMKKLLSDQDQNLIHNHQRDVIFDPQNTFALGSMMSLAAHRSIGAVKVAGVFPFNSSSHKDVHQGAIMLFDTKKGELLALINATLITAMRTAALSAVATDLLSPKHFNTMTVFGAGVQAYYHILAVNQVRPLQNVHLINRNLSRAKKLVQKIRNISEIPISIVSDIPQVPQIISMCTSADQALLKTSMLPQQCHINAVGSCTKNQCEVDSDVIFESQIFVDDVKAALQDGGEFHMAKKNGVTFSLNNLCSRLNQTSTLKNKTFFKSVGLSIQDLYCAHFVYRSLLESHELTSLEFGGEK